MDLSTALIGWKGYAAALVVGAIVAGGAAWKAQSWRYGAEISAMKSDQSALVAESQRQAREILERRVAEVGQINERNAKAEWAAYGGMRNEQVQDDSLRADVDAGRQRLHVAATCPAASIGVPKAGASARVGDGARAELDPTARPDYFSLRAGIRRVTAQLAACQARLP
ncbi:MULTISPECIES: lysis system i-spanin subunit Rz [Achromobacter]|uniref:Lysis system i-spanin subunit Rz n=1 Tax=Achromobacter spanius TaxID=217203 RepID=A0ABY8GRZ6_9BURK|nr:MULTISPECIES: lysis system i-spanin subunit Rz [Achromobacter]WAI83185.1 lysis protein [Achromobacter spanius]WEX93270.1 lysis protein [Achromobacter sp. SS2-2022]WFP07572.1 lysis system i-spanin subunit Rz [Achromobacter spanius]